MHSYEGFYRENQNVIKWLEVEIALGTAGES